MQRIPFQILWSRKKLFVLVWFSIGFESKTFDRVGSCQFFVARVRSDQPFLVLVWKISPKNHKFFNFFPSVKKNPHWVGSKSARVKDGSASYLLRVKSMLGSRHIFSLIAKALAKNKKLLFHVFMTTKKNVIKNKDWNKEFKHFLWQNVLFYTLIFTFFLWILCSKYFI